MAIHTLQVQCLLVMLVLLACSWGSASCAGKLAVAFASTRPIRSTFPSTGFVKVNLHRSYQAPLYVLPKIPEETPSSPSTKRFRFLSKLAIGTARKDGRAIRNIARTEKKARTIYNITTQMDLDNYWKDDQRRFRKDEKGTIDYDWLIRSLNVSGDTQIIGDPSRPEYVHPVAQLVHERQRRGTALGQHKDGCKLALAVEGGGMRGCVTAGMICALHHLNLTSVFDVIYGSSAGSITSAYFITGQLPWFGPEVYYDQLTTAGKNFIDSSRLFRALGLGLLDPRLYRDVITRPDGKPVLNLKYLLKTTVKDTKPLDWDKFLEQQTLQPLNVVTSGLKSQRSIVLSYENGGFENLNELTDCMHASCLLPGIAGPVMNLDMRSTSQRGKTPKLMLGNGRMEDYLEPLADALIYEPLPYRSAVAAGATHVVVLRSRPDGTDVTGKGGIFERMIFRRFLLRKNRLPHMFQRLSQQLHKKLYAEQVIEVNEAAYSKQDFKDTSNPHLLGVALPPGSPEVVRLETGREAIFEGIRRGFARAYDCLVEDPKERGRGQIVAKEYFPDEILDYDPLTISETDRSAFEVYMKKSGITPKSWGDKEHRARPTVR